MPHVDWCAVVKTQNRTCVQFILAIEGEPISFWLLCDRAVRYEEKSGHPRLQGMTRPESSVLRGKWMDQYHWYAGGGLNLQWCGKERTVCTLEYLMVLQMSYF